MCNPAFVEAPRQATLSDLDANPVLVEITRGDAVESRHRGRAVVIGADGAVELALGDAHAPVFPRSSIKMLQALPLVESGAADACGASAAELALACASHNGEDRHVAAVGAWLARLGLAERDLECGPHPPVHGASAEALVRAGRAPDRTHNNCSGKHTGFLALAQRLGVPTEGYSRPDHPVQRHVAEALGAMTDTDLDHAPMGVDGCGVPTWGVPLVGLARAMARVACPAGLAPARRQAIERLRAAVAAEPFMIAGSARLCTALVEATRGDVLIKTGAEGVFVAAVPRRGLGFALKIDDGSSRASEVAILALLRRFDALQAGTDEALRRYADPGIGNTQGRRVGAIRPAAALVT
jgi:L-asparaginase II